MQSKHNAQLAPATDTSNGFSAHHRVILAVLSISYLALFAHFGWLSLKPSLPSLRAMQPLHTYLPSRDPLALHNVASKRRALSQLPIDQAGSALSTNIIENTPNKLNKLFDTSAPHVSFFDPRAATARHSTNVERRAQPTQKANPSGRKESNIFDLLGTQHLSDTDLLPMITLLAKQPARFQPARLQTSGLQTGMLRQITTSNIGPAPKGIFFRLTLPAASQTLLLRVPLAKRLQVYELTQSKPSAMRAASKDGLNKTIELEQTTELNIGRHHSKDQRIFIGYIATDYPSSVHITSAPESTPNGVAKNQSMLTRIKNFTNQIFISGTGKIWLTLTIILGLGSLIGMTLREARHLDWRPPWQHLVALATLACSACSLILISFAELPLDPMLGLAFGITLVWVTLHLALPVTGTKAKLRLCLLPLLIGLMVTFIHHFAPVAKGPMLLLLISALSLHCALLQFHWPHLMHSELIKNDGAKFKTQYCRKTLRFLPIIALGFTGICFFTALVPLIELITGRPGLSPDLSRHWHIALLSLLLCATCHAATLLQLARDEKRKQALARANRAHVQDMNRDILTKLSQRLTVPDQHTSTRQPATGNNAAPSDLASNIVPGRDNMRTENTNACMSRMPARIDLHTIGESQRKQLAHERLEKVAEYADISALLDEDATWARNELNVQAWVVRHVKTWSQRAHRQNLQLIISIKPNTPLTILTDEDKITHMLQSFLDISINSSETGNIILRIDSTENDAGELIYRLTLQDNGTGLPDNLERLLKMNWLTLMAKPLDQAHIRYARILLAHRWLYLAQGKLSLEHDPLYGTRFQVSFKTHAPRLTPLSHEAKPQSVEKDPASSNTKCSLPTSTLLMTYDADYATTMAEQANHHNNPMSLALSVKQAMQNLQQAQNAERSFDAIIVDFSRDAESLQGFLFELKEQPTNDDKPVILLTHPYQKIDYLTHIMREVYAIDRPGYYPHLNSAIASVLSQSRRKNAHPPANTSLSQAALPAVPKLSDL